MSPQEEALDGALDGQVGEVLDQLTATNATRSVFTLSYQANLAEVRAFGTEAPLPGGWLVKGNGGRGSLPGSSGQKPLQHAQPDPL